MKSRVVSVGVGTLAIALLGCWLHQASVSASLVEQRTQDIDAIREQLANLDRDVLLSRHDATMEATIDADWAQLRSLQLHLVQTDHENPHHLGQLSASLEAESHTLQNFRSSNAVLRAAEEDFGTSVQALERPRIGDGSRVALNQLEASVLAYDNGQRSRFDETSRALVAFSTNNAGLPPALVAKCIEAAAVIERLSDTVDLSLKRAIDNRSAEEAVAAIEVLYDRQAQSASNRAAVELAALGLLVVALIALLFRAQVQLERRVIERTVELTAAREQLEFSERLATIGTLAAGIAHEINNPATYIMSNAAFLRDELVRGAPQWVEGGALDLPPAQDLIGAAAAVQAGIERITSIVRDLKVLSRDSARDAMTDVSLLQVIQLALRMATSELTTRVEVVAELAEAPSVAGNASRLGQVFLNLFINAAHAMAGQSDARLKVSLREARGALIVDVADNGSGIPEANLKRIFEPFFTTKPVGVGTGLGLAICHSIITKHGGSIAARSTLGAGTTFTVTLPVAESSAGVEPNELAALAAT